MVRKVTPLNELDTSKILLGEAKTGGRTTEEKTRTRKGISLKEGKGDERELLLRTDFRVGGKKRDCLAYGFKEQNGTYCMPLVINDDLANALDDIAIEPEKRMRIVGLTPVYKASGGNRIYARVVMSRGGVMFSNIYDQSSKTVKPEDKQGVLMNVRAVIRVDAVFFGDRPKIQISLIEAEVNDTEMVREKLL